jgi:hypothetical protein
LFALASSNENTSSHSFSPSVLLADLEGNCFEQSYSTRQYVERTGDETGLYRPLKNDVRYYMEMGYALVDGDTIELRFSSIVNHYTENK